MLESLLTKIAVAVFKQAAVASQIKAVASAYSIYSVVDTIMDFAHCVDTINECDPLQVCGVRVVSDQLSDDLIQRLVQIGAQTFVVEQRKSGVCIVSGIVPKFRANIEFPSICSPSKPQSLQFPSILKLGKPSWPK